MEQIAGIKYTKDRAGKRYVRVDLDRYGDNELIEDFLDGLEAQALKGQPAVSLSEFNAYIDSKLNNDVQSNCQ
jgi:hypothetical protein